MNTAAAAWSTADDPLAITTTAQTTLPVCLPADTRGSGRALLNRQFWFWGQDIRRPDGNLLLLHGFARRRPPDGLRGSSTYALRLDHDRLVVLWGFGLFFSDPALGGMFLPRFRLAPLLVDADHPPFAVWEPTRLPPRSAPATADDWCRAHALFVPALRWIAAYERWALATLGAESRRTAAAAWGRPGPPAEDAPSCWLRLARRCDASITRALAAGDRLGKEDAIAPRPR